MRKFDLLNFAREAAAGAPDMVRRRLLTAAAASLALPGALASGKAWGASAGAGFRVLIVGGGVGGATAAKYLKMWAPDIEVTVIERNPSFVRHYGSSEHLTGAVTMQDLTVSYDGLRARGGAQIPRPAHPAL